MKICRRCNEEKELFEFYKHKKMLDGHLNICISCYKVSGKKYRDEHKEYNKNYKKKYRKNNKEKISKYKKENYEKNKKEILKKQKEYYFKTHEKQLKYRKEYRENNKEKMSQYKKEWAKKNKDKIKNRFEKLRKQTQYRIAHNIRSRITLALKNNHKSKRTFELIGCTIEELKKHLEKQFKPGMNWDNYGLYGWHIDHKIPCAVFNLSDPLQQEICFRYTNLQPLWAEDNLSKGAKLV